MDEEIGVSQQHPAKYWHVLDDGRIQCDVCPRDCKLHDGQRGACFVRGRVGERMVLTTYGRSSGFCIDPIEKKPLNHFYPGSSVFSFGTAGCNLACKFCQNWDISKSRDMDRLMDQASPAAIASAAREHGSLSVAFTYNDPVVFLEYALDTADACHQIGLMTVAVTAGTDLDDARRMAEEALALHVEGMIEDGEAIPEPSSLEAIMSDPANREAVAVLIPLKSVAKKAVRLNITLPEDVLRVGVCFAEQIVTELPNEPHDEEVDVVLSQPA